VREEEKSAGWMDSTFLHDVFETGCTIGDRIMKGGKARYYKKCNDLSRRT
jgi:hypothetical protein